jgi:putative transposase
LQLFQLLLTLRWTFRILSHVPDLPCLRGVRNFATDKEGLYMSFYIPRRVGSRFTALCNSYAQHDGLPFASVLTEEQIQRAAVEEGVCFGADAECVFSLATTLWAFITQFTSDSRTCVAAVARVMVLLVAMGREPCSANTGAYCKARAKLPEGFLRRLTYEVGNAVEDESPDAWRWRDLRALLVDGFDIQLADTEANQAEYPQPTTQRPGVGFPMMRVVVLLAFASAALVGASFGPYAGKETGESALLRQLFDQLRADDIIVADRYYCSYFMIAALLRRGGNAAFRMHQLRHYDFNKGRRLGPDDHIVNWVRPQRPDWMDAATYATMPETITVREVRYRPNIPGFRCDEIIVATTLLDNQQYSRADIADLFHQRWHAELDIRSIKQTLKMELINCKTPAMSRKALWAHLLGYNLIRKVAAQAAREHGLVPRQISFAGAKQTLEAFRWLLIASDEGRRPDICKVVLLAIATHKVGDRPNRVEPRRVKRQKDKYPALRMPREEARARVLNGQD